MMKNKHLQKERRPESRGEHLLGSRKDLYLIEHKPTLLKIWRVDWGRQVVFFSYQKALEAIDKYRNETGEQYRLVRFHRQAVCDV